MRQYTQLAHYKEFLPGSSSLQLENYAMEDLLDSGSPNWPLKFRSFKVVVDLSCAIVALPLIGIFFVLLTIVNPWLNPGPVFFSQMRIGRNGKPFRMWKFRTMEVSNIEVRDPNSPLEEDRITRLGRHMRLSRLDEIPNLINVLFGEMSVVGPRPDAMNHVQLYSKQVSGYSERHRIKPGITGLAQVELGYVENEDGTAIKAKYDNIYVERGCRRLDLYIIVRTFFVMARRTDAR